MTRLNPTALIATLSLAAASFLIADPVWKNTAMDAETILQARISDNEIRLEYEIGSKDQAAFLPLLPPGLLARAAPHYAASGRETAQWQLLLNRQDFAQGQVTAIALRRRVPRDDRTGEALPPDKQVGAPEVLAVEVVFQNTGRPEIVQLAPQHVGKADIGFVVWHHDVAVNDFRRLEKAEDLLLDWDDPWFTRFANPKLSRLYTAPAQAFVTLDATETRLEILVRARDLPATPRGVMNGARLIPAGERQAVLRQAREYFVNNRGMLQLDGKEAPLEVTWCEFVTQGWNGVQLVGSDADLPASGALLGLVLSAPTRAMPRGMTFTWPFFNMRVQRVPCFGQYPGGSDSFILLADAPKAEWTVPPARPAAEPLSLVPPAPAPAVVRLPWAAVAAAGMLLAWLALIAITRPPQRGWAVLAVLALGGGLTSYLAISDRQLALPAPWRGDGQPPSAAEAERITTALVRNSYTSFQGQTEAEVLAGLEASLQGDALRQFFAEIMTTLDDPSTTSAPGSGRVRGCDVQSVELLLGGTRESFTTRGTWVARSHVQHWGHAHPRLIRYAADFQVAVRDGRWKIVGVRIREKRQA